MTSYLLISSAYRDRLLYPNPSDFIVPFQNTNNSLSTVRSSVLTAVNPLSLYPACSFCWTDFGAEDASRFRTRIVGGSGETMVLPREDVNTVLLGIGGNGDGVWQDLRRSNDLLKSSRVGLVAEPSQTAYVRAFSPVYSSVTLTERLPFRVGDEIEIVNDTRVSEGRVVLPGSYNGRLFVRNDLVLYDLNTNERRACSLEAVTSVLVCAAPFSPAARSTDKFLLFPGQRPFLTGSLEPFLDGRWYADAALREWRIAEAGRGYLAGERVALARADDPTARTTCVFRVVGTGVDGEISALERIEAGTDPYRLPSYRVVPLDRPVDAVSAAHVLVLATSTAFRCRFTEAATITRQDLVGAYLSAFLFSPLFSVHDGRLYTSPNAAYPVPVTGPDLRTMQEAAGVVGIEDVLFLGRNEVVLLTQAVSPALLRRFGLYEPSPALTGALNVAVFPFQGDGVVPLNFTGTYLTQSQMACYEITVLSLILPNVPLDALDTLLTSGYPYVLLEISNVSQPNAHNRNVIYSNNPAAVASTFVCSISDVNDPLRTRFIKITSDGTVQTMKFTPADSLRVRVLLPSGEPLLLREVDYGPPCVADPALQIETLLQFRKI